VRIISVAPQTDPLWQRLVAASHTTVFQSQPWMQVLSDTYGFEILAYLLLDDSGVPVAGIPFAMIHDIRGQRRVSLPFSDYCDPLVQDPRHWSALANHLLAEPIPFALRCLHNLLPLADSRLPVVNQAKWHGVELQPGLETLWQAIDGSAKRAIRKAQQHGVTVGIAEDITDLRAFYDMHLCLRKYKYEMLAQPYLFFANIWRHFIEQELGILLVARWQGQIIGATLFLEWQNSLFYKFNASAPTGLAVRPNDLIIWQAIQYAKAKGLTTLDFGLSDWDQDGLVRYKRKFSSEEKTIYFLQHVPGGEPGVESQQVRNLLPKLTALFTDESVPDQVTERAGELLYRYFV
jgi:CelD/BcsL family acetyltransferase involved in cellulose biosynthesis